MIRMAVESQDEVHLDELIEEARQLGAEFKWQDELDMAESSLYEITCANNSPFDFASGKPIGDPCTNLDDDRNE